MTASANIVRRIPHARVLGLITAILTVALFSSVATANAAISVSTTTPASGAVVSGNVSWQASATSPDGIKSVRFSINDQNVWYEGVAPYVYNGDGNTWNTKDFADGSYQLKVIATSKLNETATRVISVTVSNTAPPPTPSVLVTTSSPANNATLSGDVKWTASASSPEGVKEVRFYGNGGLMYTDTAAPWSYGGDTAYLNTKNYPDSSYQLAVEATSTLGAIARHTITVTVNNSTTTPPPESTTPVSEPTPPVTELTPPPPSGSFSALALDHSRVLVSWPASTGATYAEVYRDSTKLVRRPAALGSYTDNMLWYSSSYAYTVRLLNSAGSVVATHGPVSVTTKALPASGFPVAFAGQPIWTEPIASNVAISPRNAEFMSYFTANAKNPNMTLRGYGIPIYETDPSDTLFGPFTCRYACDINRNGKVPIPDHAVPDPGTDLHMTVASSDGKTSWDYYKPIKDASGVWSSTTAGVIIDMAGNGIVSKNLAGANAANMASLAGLIRPEELAQGRIDHALVLGIPGIAGGAPACPATHNVGVGGGIIPEGVRFQLAPTVNVETLAIPAWQKTIARALQKYGAYLRDNSGTLSIYAETSSTTVGGRRYDGWNKSGLGFTTTGSSQGFSSAFPWNKLRVLDFKYGPDC